MNKYNLPKSAQHPTFEDENVFSESMIVEKKSVEIDSSEKEVFEFLSRFTEWVKYEHKVLANIKGTLVPVPFNMTSLFNL